MQSTCFGTKIETGVDSKGDSGSQGQYREQRRGVRGKMTCARVCVKMKGKCQRNGKHDKRPYMHRKHNEKKFTKQKEARFPSSSEARFISRVTVLCTQSGEKERSNLLNLHIYLFWIETGVVGCQVWLWVRFLGCGMLTEIPLPQGACTCTWGLVDLFLHFTVGL